MPYLKGDVVIEWDDRKNEDNFKKHGVWFEEAQSVIWNPLSLVCENNHPSGTRMEYLGFSHRQRVLFVVTVKGARGKVRLSSARKATT